MGAFSEKIDDGRGATRPTERNELALQASNSRPSA